MTSQTAKAEAQPLLCGAVAGAAARIAIAPLDLLKIRLQSSVPLKYGSTLQTITTVLREEGPLGTTPGIALYAAYGSIEFRAFKSALLTALVPSPFIRGAIAAGAATALTYPLDIIRTRAALQARHTSIVAIISDIYCREGGLPAFYRGIASALVQVVPQMGVAFGVHAELRGRLGDFWAGGLGGIAGKTVAMPLDVVRRRYQVHWSSKPGAYAVSNLASLLPTSRKRLVHELAAIARREGIRGLFAGWTMAVAKAAPATAITFAVYGWCEGAMAARQ